MPFSDPALQNLARYVRETSYLESMLALLDWDQQTMLPKRADAYRSEQVAFLSGQIHRRRTSAELGEMLESLSDSPFAQDPHSDGGATIRVLKQDFDKHVKLPIDLVQTLAGATSQGQSLWMRAREDNDFASFQPQLKLIFELKRDQADAIGFDDCRYDALLDEFEPGAKTANITRVLEDLRVELVPLVAEILESQASVPIEVLHRNFPVDAQRRFGKEVSAKLGFDYQRGRLDVAFHPFCTETGPNDCRITTRFDESFFSSAFFGTLHESGHGIYEQGLRVDFYGLPPGKYCSLGIHESQSRLWENLVGRSLGFWRFFYPQAQALFPEALSDVSLEDFYGAINAVTPSLIRVEADEATYNLHIIIRFQLEQALINGDLDTVDLPSAWNEKYQKFLGISPTSDADGVLQDIHWSAGLVGYFSTYSLGNLYASQFFETADSQLDGLESQFEMGEFEPLKHWLNENVHRPGKCYSGPELGEMVTGQSLSHKPLMKDLRERLSPIYGL